MPHLQRHLKDRRFIESYLRVSEQATTVALLPALAPIAFAPQSTGNALRGLMTLTLLPLLLLLLLFLAPLAPFFPETYARMLLKPLVSLSQDLATMGALLAYEVCIGVPLSMPFVIPVKTLDYLARALIYTGHQTGALFGAGRRCSWNNFWSMESWNQVIEDIALSALTQIEEDALRVASRWSAPFLGLTAAAEQTFLPQQAISRRSSGDDTDGFESCPSTHGSPLPTEQFRARA